MPKSDENVQVVVRCRPMNPDEKHSKHKYAVEVDEEMGRLEISEASNQNQSRPFSFDHVFGYASNQQTQQMDIYNLVARPIVEFCLQGYNGTIFAYGQTGTGKTFTMEGLRSIPEKRGIIPNSFAHIFGHINKEGKGAEWLVQVSYLEIYQENIRDLLVPSNEQKHLELKEHPETGVYVHGIKKFMAKNADELNKLMSQGNKNRAVGSTKMNETSSRSHAIFQIRIECQQTHADGSSHVRVGKLNLVDLAGSERQSKTGASGERLKEATKINLSLSTLGNVISALVDPRRADGGFIPYRNSKLTRLLQDSLGGNSKTLMIANVGPSKYNTDETMSTLRYANNAKKIKNKAKINEDPKDAILRKLQTEIEELKRKLENGETISEDEADDSGENMPGKISRKRKTRRTLRTRDEIEQAQDVINKQRRALKIDEKLAKEDKVKAELELKKREHELSLELNENKQLENKLKTMESKVLVGGENLIDKHDAQESMLNEANKELDERKLKINKAREDIENLNLQQVNLEERYKSLEEEAVGKTKKLKKVFTMLYAAKGELDDMRANHEREMENLVDNCKDLSHQLGMSQLIVESYIPDEFISQIQEYVLWNESIGEWQLKGIAYAGNNMMLSQKQMKEANEKSKESSEVDQLDLTGVYMAYSEESLQRTMNHSQEIGLTSHSSPEGKRERARAAHEKKQRKMNGLMDSVLNAS